MESLPQRIEGKGTTELSLWMRRTLTILMALLLPITALAEDSPWIIDTHAHLLQGPPNGPHDAFAANLAEAVDSAAARMNQFGIAMTLLMSPPKPSEAPRVYEVKDLREPVGRYPRRFALLGGGGSLNQLLHETPADKVTDEVGLRFRKQAESLLADGAIGFGEIAIHHLSLRRMGPQHAYESVAADHPLLLLLVDIAAEHDVPIDIHFDAVPEDIDRPARPVFNPATPERLKANLDAFERLLEHNPQTRIIWAHAGTDPLGTRTPAMQRQLLKRHPNLFMSLRFGTGGKAPFFALDSDLSLKREWLSLLQDFPDRFVIGSDFFHGSGGQRGPDEMAFDNYQRILHDMPPPLATAIAHGNAERLYHLAPLQAGR